MIKINVNWKWCIFLSVILSVVLCVAKPPLSTVISIASGVAGLASILGIVAFLNRIPKIVKMIITCAIYAIIIMVVSIPIYILKDYVKIGKPTSLATSVSNIESEKPEDEQISIKPESTEVPNYLQPDMLEKEISNNERQYIPIISEDSLIEVFFVNDIKFQQIDNVVEKQQGLNATVASRITKYMGTFIRPDLEALKVNNAYTIPATEANELEEGNKNNMTQEVYFSLIDKREEAYKAGKTRALAILIARDYLELGHIFSGKHLQQEAFNYYIKSIFYYNEVIGMTYLDSEYKNDIYDICYKISDVYHNIGDIYNIDVGIRVSTYQMSLAYLLESGKSNEYKFNSCYYGGMLYHKLGILLEKKNRSFLDIASDCYSECLGDTYKTVTRKNLYRFIVHTCTKQIEYIKNNGHKDGMLTKKEYEQKRNTALSEIEKLEKPIS